MTVTDPRTRVTDSDSDGLTADIRTSDPASDTPGIVVRIAGTVPSGSVPSGGATSANQDTEITRLTTIASNTAIPATTPSNYNVTPTSTATALANLACLEVLVQSDDNNEAESLIYVGGSSISPASNIGIALQPGDYATYRVANANLVYHACTTASQTLKVQVTRP